MKILVLTHYARKGGSSRIRFYQYIPYLSNQGFSFTVAPLLNDAYLEKLYEKHTRAMWHIVAGYVERVRYLLMIHHYDIVWIEKELFPWLPGFVERLLVLRGVPYVVDYDDAIFHSYDLHRNRWIRRVLGKKIDSIMRNAALVITCNDYLANRARLAGARRVEIIPSVVDLNQYTLENRTENDVFTIGWIGSPSTAKYLHLIQPALSKICQNCKVRVVLVGSGPIDLGEVPVEIRPWSEETQVMEIHRFDVGISPLYNGPWELGKCGFKLIQYMACGKPVVASPVGQNKVIVDHGVEGFLASTTDEWINALTTLYNSPELRIRMGKAGRAKVEKEFNVQVTATRLAELLMSVSQNPTGGYRNCSR